MYIKNYYPNMQAFEILKSKSFVVFDTNEKSYVLIDANSADTLEKFKAYNKSFELVLDTSNRIESYVKELNPLAYDIIDYSEKPIVLVCSGAKNVSEKAMLPNESIQLRVVREGSLQQLIRKYRLPLVLSPISDEDRSEIPADNVIMIEHQDAFEDSGLIRLEANGRVEVIRN